MERGVLPRMLVAESIASTEAVSVAARTLHMQGALIVDAGSALPLVQGFLEERNWLCGVSPSRLPRLSRPSMVA